MKSSSMINHLLATLLSICAITEIASAWQSICAPGDDYIERNFMPMPTNRCGACTAWCNSKCSSIDMFMIQNECREVGTSIIDCLCCCGKVAPTGPPPAPSAPKFSEDTGKPHNVCTSEQVPLLISREQARDCPFNPLCKVKCKEQGRSSARSECWGASRDFKETAFTWYEQCCCGDVLPPPSPPPPSPPPPSPSPPPPSHSPPPPSPFSPPPPSPPPSPPPPPPCPSPPQGSFCGCCNTDIDIQISIKSGDNAQVPKTSSSSTGGTCNAL